MPPPPPSRLQRLGAIAPGTAGQRVYLPLVCSILLLPVGLAGHWIAWLGGSLVVLGCWISMLGVGFAVHLASVWAGLSPSFAQVLDAIRGGSEEHTSELQSQ